MRQLAALPCLLTIASLGAACAGAPTGSSANSRASESAVILNGHRIGVEIADTDASRERGLMGRTSMPADHGMLFVFPDSQIRTFWMKDTLIPLDMLFFDPQRKAVTVLSNVPPCKADPCTIYPSTAPARYVLELNAGVAAKLGVHNGDTVKFVNVPPTQ